MDKVIVFVSSVFREMEQDRDHLCRHTFVRLEAEAARMGLRFGYVDLRWGLSSQLDATEVIRSCLDLVGECRPYFLALIGQRYGWAPDEAQLQALGPMFSEQPAPGTSITELEILRFFEGLDPSSGEPKGLFLFKKHTDAQGTCADQPQRLQRLRERIVNHPLAESQEYTPDEQGYDDIDRRVFDFFLERMRQTPAPSPAVGFPVSVVPPIPVRVFDQEQWVSRGAESLRTTPMLFIDSADATLRPLLVEHVAQRFLDHADHAVSSCYVHIGAEGILTSCSLLQRLKLDAQTKGDQRLVVLDGLDLLEDWHAEEDSVQSLHDDWLFEVLPWIQQQAAEGARFILGANWKHHASRLGVPGPGSRTILSIKANPLSTSDGIQAYFRENFAKGLTTQQAKQISAIVGNSEFSSIEILLWYDMLRRLGELKSGEQAQDDFLSRKIETLPHDSTTLWHEVFTSIAGKFGFSPERTDVAKNALALLAVSRFGLSYLDLRDALSAHGGLLPEEWALLRGYLGPTLLGTIGRARISDEEVMRRIATCVGDEALARARRRLIDVLCDVIDSAPTLNALCDPQRLQPHEILHLVRSKDGDELIGHLFDRLGPRLILSLTLGEEKLAADVIIKAFDPARFDPDVIRDPVVQQPWRYVDDLADLVTRAFADDSAQVPATTNEETYRAFRRAMVSAERNTHSMDSLEVGELAVRVRACGLAPRRALFLLDGGRADELLVTWAWEWTKTLVRSVPPETAPEAERAWMEYGFFLAIWIGQDVSAFSRPSQQSVEIRNLLNQLRMFMAAPTGVPPPTELRAFFADLEESIDDQDGRMPAPAWLEDWSQRLKAWAAPSLVSSLARYAYPAP